ncbi:1-deoxy-D-xylulose-5-phosphate reductoisomerase [Desulfonatronospira sp.]|uniref:1-deoxy-D-xylulose-5-phosphate reductoisomerase n=1 Tax=Desulfonatronospira sp. TaxID=1962951 RepID=UPI0025BCD4F4|nr:1-deoxy-D-xylulose-5-phosphate reductoisomerase [Desulfonatronospira sp.]
MQYISDLDLQSRPDQPRCLAILGSTGSIGTSALKVIRRHPEKFRVKALAGARNIELLAEQANEFRPDYLGVLEEQLAHKLRDMLASDYSPEILVDSQGYNSIASLLEVDMVLSAMVGAAGLLPTLEAVDRGKIVLLANKESLVLAGHLIRAGCKRSKAVILPVDSEHNALFQALQGHEAGELDSVILTASGGPFWGRKASSLEDMKPEQALAHPNWSMGAKISIDSATMMNKGLELIEAHHLFGISMDRVRVLVHPQSIVHALVQFRDGSVLAHMGVPDMQMPIAHCLGYPQRLDPGLAPLDLAACTELGFYKPDPGAFPCLELAVEAMKSGPSYPVVLNAANEICVDSFLAGRIGFMDIPRINSRALEEHSPTPVDSPREILNLDHQTRQRVSEFVLHPAG